MLVAIWNMLSKDQPYIDLGSSYSNQFNPEKKINSYLKKLAELGWQPPTSIVC